MEVLTMLDPAIKEFFDQRKEAWLKKNLKPNASNEEIEITKKLCEETFELSEWLPNAAKRAGQISISTHPCTFSHPSARKNKNGNVTSSIAKCASKEDGYLRTGNVNTMPDALGNAAALDVYKFLNIKLQDDLTIIQHLTEDTEQAKKILSSPSATYEELKEGFLKMVAPSEEECITSSKIKQVYFPVDNDYHQLSILTNSGLIFELRKRLDDVRFGEEIKTVRELKKENKYSDRGYKEIYNLTTIGYGGTKPQNISVLNNQHGGKTYLLASIPPELKIWDIRFPKKNLFDESLYLHDFKELFFELHNVMIIEVGGDIPRQKILTALDNKIQAIVLKIMDVVYRLREVSINQYSESCALPNSQVIWICKSKSDERLMDDIWLDDIINHCVRWILNNYSKLLGDKQIMLGNTEFDEIKARIQKWVAENKEFLR